MKRAKLDLLAPYDDGGDDEDHDSIIKVVVDPIAVARKTLHTESSSEKEEEQEEEDCKPAAINTTISSKTNSNNDNDTKDRLSNLNPDLLCKITSFLDPAGLLLQLGATNRFYHHFCRQNRAGWEALCQQEWKTKTHVLPAARRQLDRCRAYREALLDARNRKWITPEELCYDGNTTATTPGTIWSFRFKESAGTDWTNADPWYRGQPCRKLAFFRDGSVREVVGMEPQQGANNEGDDDATARIPQPSPQASNDNIRFTLVDPPMRMTWRFLTRPMDLPERPPGSYVRFNVGGRDVPTYAVSRSPTGNWGFVMESCWGVYGSFELPPRRRQQRPAREARRTVLRRRGGDGNGAVWVAPDEEDEDSNNNNGNSNNVQQRAAAAAAELQDESLRLTNEVQWREAFLYNVGARNLPEGDQATDEFDRAWQGQF